VLTKRCCAARLLTPSAAPISDHERPSFPISRHIAIEQILGDGAHVIGNPYRAAQPRHRVAATGALVDRRGKPMDTDATHDRSTWP